MLSSKTLANVSPWIFLALEALIVMTSVLLALALNSWKEGRDHEQVARQALQGVLDETSINCARIAHHQPYHLAVATRSRDPEGIISLLRNDAWDSARSNGATAHIDYEVAARIGSIYALQSDHRTMVQSYMQAIYMAASNLDEQDGLHQIHGALDVAVTKDMVRVRSGS